MHSDFAIHAEVNLFKNIALIELINFEFIVLYIPNSSFQKLTKIKSNFHHTHGIKPKRGRSVGAITAA